MKVYILSNTGRQCEWQVWKHMGGCGLSDGSRSIVGKVTPKTTLGELQDRCVVAGRELARFAHDRLNLADWAVVEYDFSDVKPKQMVRRDGRWQVVQQQKAKG